MAFTETMQHVIDILGSSQGLITMAIAAAVGIGSPFMDRLVIRRKRIQYHVEYNSRIGLTPEAAESDEDKAKSKDDKKNKKTHPELKSLVEQLDKLSVMTIRVRNVGSSDIDVGDINPPLTVTFSSRVVWDARISEADDDVRKDLLEKMAFVPDASAIKADEPVVTPPPVSGLARVRGILNRRWADTLNQPPAQAKKDKPAEQWRSVRLDDMWLHRKQSFILVLVLHEANNDADGITKDDYEITGGHRNGRTIVEPKPQRRFTSWPVWTTGIGVIVVGALVGTLVGKAVIGGQHPVVVAGVPCTTGTVDIAGSSAFGPIVQTVGQTYEAQCPGAHVNVDSSGSLDGVRDLEQQSAGAGADDVALSDGKSVDSTAGLRQQMVAVLVYGLVVNANVGIDRLTIDQVSGIYSGKYTNWDQLGGTNEPIQIVGRGGGSGTRQAFERYVLHASEGVLSSNNCLTKDLTEDAPTIQCERGTTQDLINAVKSAPGAIGYADISDETTKQAIRAGTLTAVSLDGRYPSVDSLPDYPFWTVEYLYTKDTQGQPVQDFLKYLSSPVAQATLLSAGYTPCFSKDNVLNPLCTSR